VLREAATLGRQNGGGRPIPAGAALILPAALDALLDCWERAHAPSAVPVPREVGPTDDELAELLEQHVAPGSIGNVRRVIRQVVRASVAAARGTCERCGKERRPGIDGLTCHLCLLVDEAQALGLYDIEENPLAD
jgi:hypothetical protein